MARPITRTRSRCTRCSTWSATFVGLLDALGAEQAVVVGHDWGAPVAWHTALFRPDRLRGVVGLSVPYRPRPPLSILRCLAGENFSQIYFQQPGVAEAELERDVRKSIRATLFGTSGENATVIDMMVHPGRGIIGRIQLPAWLSETDVEFYTGEFQRTGFRGGLNWYRNIDRELGDHCAVGRSAGARTRPVRGWRP